MTAPAYIPDAGDLIWTDFDPTPGREQAGRRPALVVSPAAFTENTGFAIVCPITSRVRPFPTSVVLPAGLPVAGRDPVTSHIRSVDTQARPVRYAGATVAPETALLVRAQLNMVVTILRLAVLLQVRQGPRFRRVTIEKMGSPNPLHAILVEHRIRRNNQHRLHQALGDQHPVEGIAMMQR